MHGHPTTTLGAAPDCSKYSSENANPECDQRVETAFGYMVLIAPALLVAAFIAYRFYLCRAKLRSRVRGGHGREGLRGNGEANVITGRADIDEIYARGDGRIFTNDLRHDKTYCGAGSDRLSADTHDRVVCGCERARFASNSDQT